MTEAAEARKKHVEHMNRAERRALQRVALEERKVAALEGIAHTLDLTLQAIIRRQWA